MNDDEFLAAFENCTLPIEHWNHRAHVRVAYLYASRYDLESATDQMRASKDRIHRARSLSDSNHR